MASRKMRSRRKHKKNQQDKYGFKILIGLIVLAVAVFARFSNSDFMTAAKQTVLSVLENGINYKDAIETFGQLVSGDKQNAADAAAVFGKKLLGVDQAPNNVYEETSPQETQSDEVTGEALRLLLCKNIL